MTTPWQIQFLGGLRMYREGCPAVSRLRTAKTTALLAFLCLNPGRDHGREELVERFWPELTFEAGRNSLRVALSSLRRALDDDGVARPSEAVLYTTRSHVRLRAGAVETDVAALEAALRRGDRARAAMLAAQGAFLPGVMDEWVYQEQSRIEALRAEALENTPEAAPQVPLMPLPMALPQPSSLNIPQGGIVATAPMTRAVAGSVPIPLGQFFGREAEIAQILTLLADPGTRLITVTGPGGTGKTRLAVEVARSLREGKAIFSPHRIGGVWFVPMITATGSGHVLPALCRAVGANLSGNDDALETLADHLSGIRGGQIVLVLDNLEQIDPEGCAATLRILLERMPQVVCLTTSRRRVGLPGERVFPLAPFPLPVADDSLSSLAAHPAIALFVDRAREADVDFVLTPRRAPQVVALCARLNGVPLALEMAASWAGVYTPDEIANITAAEGGNDGTSAADTLAGRHAGRDSRHRSLRAVAEWSIRLLPPDARDLLATLSLFQGRWDREIAGCVASDTFSSERLALLCDHSLVDAVTEESEDGSRSRRCFQIMPSLLPFAQKLRLELGDGGTAAQEAHARCFFEIARTTRMAPDILPDTLAALDYYEADPKRLNSALELVGALWNYWWTFGQWDEGQSIANRVLVRATESSEGDISLEALREALRCAGKLAFYRYDFDAARDFMNQRLAIEKRLGHTADIVFLQANFATLDIAAGRYEEACAAFETLLPALADMGEQGETQGSYVYSNYAEALFKVGRIDAAQAAAEAHLHAIAQRGVENDGLQGLDYSLLAEIYRSRGQSSEARRYAEISLAIFRVRGETFRIADVLLILSGIARESGDRDYARATLRESFALRRRVPSSDGFRRSVAEAEYFLAAWPPMAKAINKRPSAAPMTSPRDAFTRMHDFLEEIGDCP